MPSPSSGLCSDSQRCADSLCLRSALPAAAQTHTSSYTHHILISWQRDMTHAHNKQSNSYERLMLWKQLNWAQIRLLADEYDPALRARFPLRSRSILTHSIKSALLSLWSHTRMDSVYLLTTNPGLIVNDSSAHIILKKKHVCLHNPSSEYNRSNLYHFLFSCLHTKSLLVTQFLNAVTQTAEALTKSSRH